MSEFLAWTNTNANAITAAATVVLVLVTIVYAWFTRGLLKENQLLRKAGTEPQIVAYLSPDERHFIIINLVMVNVGSGPALNVVLRFEADEEDLRKHDVRLGSALTQAPLPVIPQGERILTSLGTGPQLLAGTPMKPIKAIAEFSNLSGERFTRSYTLDIAQLMGLIRTGTPATDELARAATKIADTISSWSSGDRRLKVETISEAERQRRDREFMEARQREAEERRASASRSE